MKTIVLLIVICTTTISAQVQKIQNLQITGGTPGVGKVLASDANGNASWQNAADFGISLSGTTPASPSTGVQKIQNLQLTGGTPGFGKLLGSDANGNVSWQSLESIEFGPFGTVVSSTGKIWMDRNLGASRVATSSTDHLAYGSLYQWGRRSDGHQLITWTSSTTGTPINSTTTTLSTTDNPGNNLFILVIPAPWWDWRDPKNDNLWQGVNGKNNPCPKGYRVPTETEVQNEITAYRITNPTRAYDSPLKIPLAGYRNRASGGLSNVGSHANLWTSTVLYTNNGKVISFAFRASGVAYGYSDRSMGFNVRCIKD